MKKKRKTQLEKRRTNKTISDQIREAERRNNNIIETIDNIIDDIILLGKQETQKHIIICSTTMPGYCNTLYNKIKDYKIEYSHSSSTELYITPIKILGL